MTTASTSFSLHHLAIIVMDIPPLKADHVMGSLFSLGINVAGGHHLKAVLRTQWRLGLLAQVAKPQIADPNDRHVDAVVGAQDPELALAASEAIETALPALLNKSRLEMDGRSSVFSIG